MKVLSSPSAFPPSTCQKHSRTTECLANILARYSSTRSKIRKPISWHPCERKRDLHNQARGSKSEEVGDELSDLLKRDSPDVLVRSLDDTVDAYGRRQVRLGDTEL